MRYLCLLSIAILTTTCYVAREPVSTSQSGRNFLVTVSASSKCVSAGETLVLRATVTNKNPETRVIELKDKPVFDLGLSYQTMAGSTILRWSDDKPLTSNLKRIALKPGEFKDIEMKWLVVNPAPNSIGVVATFVADPSDIDHPLSPFMTISGEYACPGPFGP